MKEKMDFCPPISKILSYSNGANLFLGSIAARSPLILIQNDIDVVVSIISPIVQLSPLPSHIQRFAFYLDDVPTADITQFFMTSSKKIYQAILHGKNVLVHCHAGISRSTSLVVAYILYCMKFYPRAVPKINKIPSYSQNILKLIREARSCVHPNSGFMQQLLAFEKSLL